MYQDDLAKLSKEELIALALAQTAQIEELTRRIADLEAKLGGPPKTPDNSSLPPSQGRKPNRAERRAAKKRKGRPGVFRALAHNPDRIVANVAERCPHCDHALTPADQSGFHAYDHIELPPIRPVITRIHRHRGVCPGCRRGFSAPPPARMPPGSPAGPRLNPAYGGRRDRRRRSSQQQGGGLGRDLSAGRGEKLVAMGAALFHRCSPSDRRQPWGRGADRLPRRDQTRRLGCRPLCRSSWARK